MRQTDTQRLVDIDIIARAQLIHKAIRVLLQGGLMPLKRFAFVLGLLLLPFCITAVAQKAEAAFVAGGSFVSDSNFSFTISCSIPPSFTDSGTLQSGRHVFVEGNPAVQVIDAKGAKLHFEVPIVGIPSHSVQ